MKPTPLMTNALQQAQRDGELRRTHDNTPGAPPWPVNHNTLHALVRHNLLTHSRRRNRHGHWMDIWEITDTGRQLLAAPNRTLKEAGSSMNCRGRARFRLMIGGVWQDVSAPEPAKVRLDHQGPSRPAAIRHEEARPTSRRRAA